MPIGVESAHGFGDACFNLPLTKAIAEKYQDEIWVAVRPHCKDAFYNIPWIPKIVEITQMNEGIPKLQNMGCHPTFQITQNIKFFEYRNQDLNHSLIDTPLCVGREIGLPEFDQKPMISLTGHELTTGASMADPRPTIAIESVYNSAQSWANADIFNIILSKYSKSHRVLWLSNSGAPAGVDDMLRFSRREAIACLQHCEIFFSVGSGFFCASLALPLHLQPKQIVCLWVDDLYKYENKINEKKWHPNLQWVHNLDELRGVLC